jgi:undecaprenyl pyrophosphate synthase
LQAKKNNITFLSGIEPKITLMEEIDKEKLPHHIAIIMDGNGRWAKKKSLNRISGHIKGVDAVREVVTACRELGIKVLTLYAFSKENWNRPKDEGSLSASGCRAQRDRLCQINI